MSDETDRALTARVSLIYNIMGLMRTLQTEKGSFTLQDLADGLMRQYRLPLEAAETLAAKMATRLGWMLQVQAGGTMQLVEPSTPNIEQTMASFKTMSTRQPPPKATER